MFTGHTPAEIGMAENETPMPDSLRSRTLGTFDLSGYEAGKGTLRAVGLIDGEEAAEYIRKAPGEADAVQLRPRSDTPIQLDGSDAKLVWIDITDADGTVVTDAYTDVSTVRTPELDALQTRMIRSNTRRQLYLGLTVASYIYFIGDAAVNYSTNDVSSVKKATTLACICPGAGQVYNRSYWKVPFVVGGFATMAYCIDWNNRGFQRFKKAYALLADYEQHPEKYPDGPTDEFQGRYSADYMKNLRDNFRRNRDLCIILTGALYVLQIIDAHVDAHLKDYDVSDDLSMNLEPMLNYAYVPALQGNRPVFGFNLGFKF